ncbi:hypothetical protein GYA25_03105 [Candidatus Woesearchaeota archaeon]|nr:hypothetical protein [Candidatus Woesearchaeota archaeon]
MKKAQIKIQQMMVMLIGVFILFSLVILFFGSIFFSRIKSDAKELEEQSSLMLSSKLANSPEFSCGNSFDSSYDNCVDFDKVFILTKNIGNYSDFYDVASIRIEKVYPKENNLTCNDGNYPDCSNLVILNKNVKKSSEVSNFVLLCKKEEENKCWLARLIVSPLIKE